jgi:hypothetical protein
MNHVQQKVMEILEMLCFHGKGNLKRGMGSISYFPVHLLYECSKILDIAAFIDNMFSNYTSQK